MWQKSVRKSLTSPKCHWLFYKSLKLFDIVKTIPHFVMTNSKICHDIFINVTTLSVFPKFKISKVMTIHILPFYHFEKSWQIITDFYFYSECHDFSYFFMKESWQFENIIDSHVIVIDLCTEVSDLNSKKFIFCMNCHDIFYMSLTRLVLSVTL